MHVKTSSKHILQLLFIILLFYFCTLPVISVIFYGIADDSVIDAQAWIRMFRLLRNSIGLSALTTIACVLLGLLATFTLHRLHFQGRRLLRILMLVPLVNPCFVGTLSFIMLFGSRGLITYRILGLHTSPYGWHGVFVLQTLSFTTLAYLIISGAVQSTDVALEDAARNLGTPERKILTAITLPMMLPEIAVAGLLVFLASMADFTTPLIIGGNFRTLASDLYLQITGIYNMKVASVTGIFLLIPCFLAFYLQRRLSKNKKFHTDQATNNRIEYEFVSPAVKALLITGTCLLISAFLIVVIFVIIGGFTKNWGYDYSFTLEHFQKAMMHDPRVFIKPLFNSVLLAVCSAFFASSIGITLAYLIYRKKIMLSGAVDFICLLPAAVPGVLFGIGYLVTFKHPMFGVTTIVLVGTSIIVYIICIARNINVAMKSCYALLEHADPDLENAAYNLGASRLQALLFVVMPSMKNAFVNSYIRIFSSCMTTLGAIIFLLLPKNKVIIQVLFQASTGAQTTGVTAIMALMLSGFTLLLMLLFYCIAYLPNAIAGLRRKYYENRNAGIK